MSEKSKSKVEKHSEEQKIEELSKDELDQVQGGALDALIVINQLGRRSVSKSNSNPGVTTLKKG